MPILNLIRHARTIANEKKIFCGKTETDVIESKESIKNILSKKICKNQLGIVYSSPSQRAIFTAMSISENIVIREELREIDFGDFEEKTFLQIQKTFPKEIKKWNDEGMKYIFPNGESIEQFYERVSLGIKEIIQENKDRDYITVFTHGGVIQAIISYMFGNIDYFWKFKLDNCSITRINITEDNIVFEFINR